MNNIVEFPGNDKQPKELLVQIEIFKSSRVRVVWNGEAFQTPEQRNWLFSRLCDAIQVLKEDLS